MHGRVKGVPGSVGPSPAEVAAQQKKAATYAELSRVLLSRRKSGDKSPETFELIATVIKSNPDFYTLWNFRKELIIDQCATADIPLAQALSASQPTSSRAHMVPLSLGAPVLAKELNLTAEAIKRNPKCYAAWHHRQWMVSLFEFDLEAELELCAMLLMADQRNFHCWNYRRFITLELSATSSSSSRSSSSSSSSSSGGDSSTLHTAIARELQFSTDKLRENFSNYSAFHHRSVCLRMLAPPALSEGFRGLLTAELGIVENAVFTEPDDQSAWWYRQFLLEWLLEAARGVAAQPPSSSSSTSSSSSSSAGSDEGVSAGNVSLTLEGEGAPSVAEFLAWSVQLVRDQVAQVEGLLEAEEGCRWAMDAIVGSVGLLQELGKLAASSGVGVGVSGSEGGLAEEEAESLKRRREELLTSLLERDPAHSRRYRALLAGAQ